MNLKALDQSVHGRAYIQPRNPSLEFFFNFPGFRQFAFKAAKLLQGLVPGLGDNGLQPPLVFTDCVLGLVYLDLQRVYLALLLVHFPDNRQVGGFGNQSFLIQFVLGFKGSAGNLQSLLGCGQFLSKQFLLFFLLNQLLLENFLFPFERIKH